MPASSTASDFAPVIRDIYKNNAGVDFIFELKLVKFRVHTLHHDLKTRNTPSMRFCSYNRGANVP